MDGQLCVPMEGEKDGPCEVQEEGVWSTRRQMIRHTLQNWKHQIYHYISLLIESGSFNLFIMVVVVVSTAMPLVQTFHSATVNLGYHLMLMDCVFLVIYFMEFVLKYMVLGRDYFGNFWNGIDFFIVVVSMVDFIIPLLDSAYSGNAVTVFGAIKVLKGCRAIRGFRVLRAIGSSQNLQSLVMVCIQTMYSLGVVLFLIAVFLFMFAVVFRELFCESDPRRFGSMSTTIVTLFQLLTLDDWSLIYSTGRENGASYIIILLVVYIVIQYFVLLNLFIAVFADNFMTILNKKQQARLQKNQGVIQEQMQALKEIELQFSKVKTEEECFQEILKKTYKQSKYSKYEIEKVNKYLGILAAIEANQHMFQSQACTLERIVDTFFEVPINDFS